MKTKIIITAVIILTLAFSTHKATAAELKEVKLELSDDTYVSQKDENAINGDKTYFSAAYSPNAANITLLKFSTDKIPANANIDSATLILNSYYCQGTNANGTMELARVTKDWSEDTTRWITRPQSILNFGIVKAGGPETKSWDVTKAVSSWYQHPSDNHGLSLSIVSGPYTCNFYSKEYGSKAPSLVVKYQAPEVDDDEPVISNVKTTDITTSEATVSWNTNEESSSHVEYFNAQGEGGYIPLVLSAGEANATKNHSVELKNLSSNTLYKYRVKSKDAAGNEASTPYATFKTTLGKLNLDFKLDVDTVLPDLTKIDLAKTDEQPVVIESVEVIDISASSAQIGWSTNKVATGLVFYRPNPDKANGETQEYKVQSSNTNTKNHAILLTDLTPNTEYEFHVTSVAENESASISAKRGFVTTDEVAAKSPVTQDEQDTLVNQTTPINIPEEDTLVREEPRESFSMFQAAVIVLLSGIALLFLMIVIILVARKTPNKTENHA